MKQNNRIAYLDLLRIVACFAIVWLHVSASIAGTSPLTSFSFHASNAMDCLVQCAVPVFVMISGVFMLNPEKDVHIGKLFKRRVFRLFLCYLFWLLFYSCFRYVLAGEFPISIATLKNVIAVSLEKPFYHLWFIPMIIMLYILTPFLRVFTAHATQRQWKYLLIIFFLFSIVQTTLLKLPFPLDHWIKSFIQLFPWQAGSFVGYYLLGYYLFHHCSFEKRQRSFLYIASAVLWLISAAVGGMLSLRAGAMQTPLMGYYTLPSFVQAISVFVFFQHRFQDKTFSPKALAGIRMFSGLTMGIYLIHPFVLELVFHFVLTNTQVNALWIPLISLMISILSALLSFLIKKIPVLRDYLV